MIFIPVAIRRRWQTSSSQSSIVVGFARTLKIPHKIDEEKDTWEFYCPDCRKWQTGGRHGYTSKFFSGMYFTCPECDMDIEAPGWWK